jgi:hypothetical protein
MVDKRELDPRFLELASRFLDGEASLEELESLNAILKSDPESVSTLAELLNQHGTLALALRGEAAYKERLTRLAPPSSGVEVPRPRRAWWMAFPIAACIAIICTIILSHGQGPVVPPSPTPSSPLMISFQDGISPTADYRGTQDTKISEHRPNERFGRKSVLEVEGGDDEGASVLLIRWDVRAIPPRSKIHSAELIFTVPEAPDRGNRYRISELKCDWSEEEASWTRAQREKPWERPGAKGSRDRSLSVLGEFKAMKGVLHIPLETEGLRTVERWVANSQENHGLVVTHSAEESGEFYLASRKAESAGSHPKLTITFTPPGD